MRVVLATGNAGKIREFAELLGPLGFEFVAQATFGIEPPEETGDTFEANALLKARYAAARSGLPAMADDSGLEVDALDGAPGIYSARFGGEAATNNERCLALLELLGDNPNRTSRFRCVIALRFPDGHVQTASGSVEGDITYSLSGTDGFGYDPIFRPKTYPQTFAEMASSQKNELSHRGRALALASQIIFAWHRETNYNAGRG